MDRASAELWVVGLISGTSADGIDAALVRFRGKGPAPDIEVDSFITRPYSPTLRKAVLRAARGDMGVREVARLHFELGEHFARAAIEVVGSQEAQLIGSHGQTVAHIVDGGRARGTLQIASPAVIAERTGLTVVSDFRAADIARGGQGAPLVSYLDSMFLGHPEKVRVALNLGGIANVTYLPPRGSDRAVMAFDTGPGNAPLDRAAALLSGGSLTRDVDGRLALSGTTNVELVNELMRHPFLALPPPRSTGREEFGDQFTDAAIERCTERGLSDADILATLTRFTATSISVALRSLGPVDEVLVSGGGVHNRALMRFLVEEMGNVPIRETGEVGVDPDAKEAIAFALLAFLTVHGLPGNVPGATGARGDAVLGSITPGSNYTGLMEGIWG